MIATLIGDSRFSQQNFSHTTFSPLTDFVIRDPSLTLGVDFTAELRWLSLPSGAKARHELYFDTFLLRNQRKQGFFLRILKLIFAAAAEKPNRK